MLLNKILMNYSTKKIVTSLCLLIFPFLIYSQGCSDAGFCTIDSFKPHEHDGEIQNKNQFKIGLNFGAADYDISVFGTNLEYNRVIMTESMLMQDLQAWLSQGTISRPMDCLIST